MVVADQLLMSRLKQICESLIVSQLTLDNVTQVYQLASTYNTLQLKVISAFSRYVSIFSVRVQLLCQGVSSHSQG